MELNKEQQAQVEGALLTRAVGDAVGGKEIRRAQELLQEYKRGKSSLEGTIVQNERWYKLRHWEMLRSREAPRGREARPEPASAWLFNSLANKHADAMDNYPEPNVLPREPGDQADAAMLSSIIPCVIERNDFEQTYSDVWWYKLKHGTGVYGVFWDNQAENGLGDISIKKLDLLNLFWEPGVTDIQQSRNLFIVDMRDNEELQQEYPQLKNKLGGSTIDVRDYIHEDTIDTSDKSVVVDWYYKLRAPGGRTLLHYCKFVGDTLLYASENDERYAATGWYDHGRYPVVFDVLFPQEGTPAGFGYINICKDPQLYIDKLSQNILENTLMASKPRYFAKEQSGVNEEEFLDWSKPLVHVQGDVDENRLRRVDVPELPANVLNVLQMKIDELKETSSNRDFSQGGTGSGVTAAAAIAALQEAGNKTSRDMIGASYRSFTQINYLCIELIRQFYDEKRSFRITGESGQTQFVQYSNAGLQEQPLPAAVPGRQEIAFRRPVFDIKVKAQKRSPYSRMAQNELAKELYGMGFFDPQRAEQAMGALELMEFEGKDNVLQRVQQGQTLLGQMQQMQERMVKMAMVIKGLTGQDVMDLEGAEPQTAPRGQAPAAGKKGLGSRVEDAQRATMTAYGDKLAERARPDATAQQGNVRPQ